MEEKKEKNRPPVVVVMGHIDHGKSTLLDYIRKTSTTEKEAGGITQHISAYEAICDISGQKRKITFLDTPGHEAFCSIRERGASVADIAVLVVSAEDGVKPQTIEALNCIRKNSMPFIVAINKIDKNGANADKTKQDLAENEVFVEGWGGTIPVVPISAKTGENVNELLEMIILQSDLEDLKTCEECKAEGFVIESKLNPKEGVSATILVKNGKLKVGDFVSTEGAFAPVRIIENYNGTKIKEAVASSPIKITGWSAIPAVGKEFKTFYSKEEAFKYSEKKPAFKNIEQITESNDVSPLTIILKTDTYGSLEAIEQEIGKINNENVCVKIVSKGIGSITEKDEKTANIKKSLIIGFNVEIDKNAELLALRDNIIIKNFNIIYELLNYVKEKIKENTPIKEEETITGVAKILKTFSKNKDKQVVGGRTEEGEIKSGSVVKIFRREVEVGEGRIKEIQSQKIKTDIVKEKEEFGMMLESKIEIAPGDMLKAISKIKK